MTMGDTEIVALPDPNEDVCLLTTGRGTERDKDRFCWWWWWWVIQGA